MGKLKVADVTEMKKQKNVNKIQQDEYNINVRVVNHHSLTKQRGWIL